MLIKLNAWIISAWSDLGYGWIGVFAACVILYAIGLKFYEDRHVE
jgi:hypothetical protein